MRRGETRTGSKLGEEISCTSPGSAEFARILRPRMPKPEAAGLLQSAEVVTGQLAGCTGPSAGAAFPAGRVMRRKRRHPLSFIKFIKTYLYTGVGRCQAKNSGSGMECEAGGG